MSLTSRPVSSHLSVQVSRVKVEKAKLVERPYDPYFALGLVAFRATQQRRRTSVDPLSHQPPHIVQLNFIITHFFFTPIHQEARGSHSEETTDQVARADRAG